jgi:hypothetical protein
MFTIGLTSVLFLAGGLAFDPLAAPATQKPNPPAQTVADASIPAEALEYGEALHAQASTDVKNWARNYAERQLRERAVDPRATMADVDKHFARATDQARDAITYLVFYLAYKDEQENQKMLAIRIKEIDRETKELMRQIEVIMKTQDNRSMSGSHPLTMQERVKQEEDIKAREAQLREYGDDRQLKATREVASGKKISSYLKLLGAVYPRMKGIEPGILRNLK